MRRHRLTDRRKQVFFAGEVVIQRTLGDPQLLGNLVQP